MVDDFDRTNEELAALATAIYVYSRSSRRYILISSGAVVPSGVVTAEMRRHVVATFDTLDGLTRQLYSGQLSMEQWQLAVAGELKDAHLAQSMYAVGGKHNMTQANFGRVGGTLADEYRYLSQFADDIAAGRISEAQALARIRQYGKATQQSYWREYAQSRRGKKVNWTVHPGESCSDCLEMEANNPHDVERLTKYPGSGHTQCRGNCNCTLEDAA